MKDDRLYLLHITESLRWIAEFVAEGKEAFFTSRKTQDAVIRNFEIIGEATKQLSADITRKHNHVPWRRIAGFRDVLIHNYIGVDLQQVWNVAIQQAPALLIDIDAVLHSLPGEELSSP